MSFKNISPTVLVVDELKNDFCLTRCWLETNGYKVREASNVCDAFDDATDFTQAERPSLILLTTALSPQDCQFVIESLREFTELQKIPIVALAGHESDKTGQDEYFVQIENLEMLKPLMNSLLPVYPLRNQATAAAA